LGGLTPSQHMLVNTIHERAVQIEEKRYRVRILRNGHEV